MIMMMSVVVCLLDEITDIYLRKHHPFWLMDIAIWRLWNFYENPCRLHAIAKPIISSYSVQLKYIVFPINSTDLDSSMLKSLTFGEFVIE